MTKRTKKEPERRLEVDWNAVLTDPLLRQILALLVVAVGVITLLALFQVTSGRWVDAWVESEPE